MKLEERQAIDEYAQVIRNVLKPLDPPITIEKMTSLVERLGGKVKPVSPDYFPEASISGSIKKTGAKEFEITYSKTDSPERNVFTIAHELGHLFMHMNFASNEWENSVDYLDSPLYRKGYSFEEVQANEFAAAFLMPKDEFIEQVKKQIEKNNTTVNLKEISDYFGVSKNAVRTRGVYLGLFKKFKRA